MRKREKETMIERKRERERKKAKENTENKIVKVIYIIETQKRIQLSEPLRYNKN